METKQPNTGDVVGQLIARCTSIHTDSNNEYIEVFDKQVFAELLIRECAWWITTTTDADGDRIADSFYWAGLMLKHYGIKAE